MLRDLAHNSTKHECESAARLFKKFLADEGVNWEYLSVCITRENAPLVLCGGQIWHVSGLQGGTRVPALGQTLGHAVLPTGQELDAGPVPRVHQTTDKALVMKGQVLERYCMKRESGSVVNKAPACTKKSLKMMVMYLYSIASTAFNYQYAALLSSDLTPLRKANLSNGAGSVFIVCFIRIKTSEELWFSLFPDNDFTTCHCSLSPLLWRHSLHQCGGAGSAKSAKMLGPACHRAQDTDYREGVLLLIRDQLSFLTLCTRR
ncbi:LOW QUALITY PROTEIN: hypothetical protein PHMEG_00036240 [Phytophthora megakarya]|uniref:Uncharacterized protein n=1 Tax=Phytophthora megakarya TaxID=4795 RepID=A0A225UMD4_9STRA|nr:LOW QUALITY PROTEIN: hypothetical protein PHMEG_00036240 [Phytophthora megakarya]